MFNCNTNCNKICPRWIGSTSITVVTVDGTDTLVIDIPDAQYNDGEQYCILTLQAIPDTATVNMPVAISIGGVTTTVYPLVCHCTGLQAIASQLCTRTKYRTCVRTNATTGSFVAYSGLRNICVDTLASLPAPATAG